jgi:hypothetical protein
MPHRHWSRAAAPGSMPGRDAEPTRLGRDAGAVAATVVQDTQAWRSVIRDKDIAPA